MYSSQVPKFMRCLLCKTAQHTCRKCKRNVCNICSDADPNGTNEMHRVHIEKCQYQKSTGDTAIVKAINSAKKHGINLLPGPPIRGDGNCAFASVLANVNSRVCFEDKLTESVNHYRFKWVTEFETEVEHNRSELASEIPAEERRKKWDDLKRNGIWDDGDFGFGDYILYAISRGCKKTLMIFYINPLATQSLEVVKPQHFGEVPTTDIPVILSYDQNHYENFIPATLQDMQQSVELVELYFNGSYTFRPLDIPYLISGEQGFASEINLSSSNPICQPPLKVPKVMNNPEKINAPLKLRQKNMQPEERNEHRANLQKIPRSIDTVEVNNTSKSFSKVQNVFTNSETLNAEILRPKDMAIVQKKDHRENLQCIRKLKK